MICGLPSKSNLAAGAFEICRSQQVFDKLLPHAAVSYQRIGCFNTAAQQILTGI